MKQLAKRYLQNISARSGKTACSGARGYILGVMKLSRRSIVGVILWWAEGTKSRRDKRWKSARSYPVELTNTNPAVIKVFVDFLREDLRISPERIHVQLQIHEGDDKTELEKYWSEITGVSTQRFNKTIVRPIGRKVGKSKGTCKVRFADKATYMKLEQLLGQVLIELYDKPNEMLQTLPHYEFVFQSVKIV